MCGNTGVLRPLSVINLSDEQITMCFGPSENITRRLSVRNQSLIFDYIHFIAVTFSLYLQPNIYCDTGLKKHLDYLLDTILMLKIQE